MIYSGQSTTVDICSTTKQGDFSKQIHFVNSVKPIFELNNVETFPLVQANVVDCKITISTKNTGLIENFLQGLIR